MKAAAILAFSISALVAASAFAATWEGTAVVGGSGDFPDNSLTADCNSFPKDSTVDLQNLENGKIVRVTIAGGLDNPGVFIILSPSAAAELGMNSGISSRIRATVVPSSALPSPDTAVASRTQDPDFNPTLLAGPDNAAAVAAAPAAAPGETTPGAAQAAIPGGSGAVGLSGAVAPNGTEAPAVAETAGSPPSFEPEKAKVIANTVPAPPQAPAAVSQLPEAQPAASTPAAPASSGAAGASAIGPSGAATQPGATVPPAGSASAETGGPNSAQATNGAALVGGNAPTPQAAAAAAAPNLEDASAPQLPASTGGPGQPALPAPSPGASTTLTAPPPTSPEPTTEAAASGGEEKVLSLEPAAPQPPEAVTPAVGAPAAEGTPAASAAPTASAATTAPEASTPEAATPASSTPAAASTAAPSTVPPAAVPATTVASASPSWPAAVQTPVRTRQPVFLDKLEKGAYYVQVAVFSNDKNLVDAAGAFDVSWPLASEKIEGSKGEQYRLFVGPVQRDESGMFVIQLRSMGYEDAFVKQGQ